MTGIRDTLRRRLDFIPAQQKTHYLRNGAIVLGVIAVAYSVAFTRSIPFLGGGGQEVRAEFATANQVSDLTPVRVAGVDVGRVKSTRAGSTPGTTIVTMRITDDDV